GDAAVGDEGAALGGLEEGDVAALEGGRAVAALRAVLGAVGGTAQVGAAVLGLVAIAGGLAGEAVDVAIGHAQVGQAVAIDLEGLAAVLDRAVAAALARADRSRRGLQAEVARAVGVRVAVLAEPEASAGIGAAVIGAGVRRARVGGSPVGAALGARVE